MKKLKLLLIAAVACLGIGFASLGTNAAETETKVYYATLNDAAKFTSNTQADGKGEAGPEFDVSTKKGFNYKATSIIDGTEKTYTAAAKLNSTGTITFTVTGDWEIKALVFNPAAKAAGAPKLQKADGTVVGTFTNEDGTAATDLAATAGSNSVYKMSGQKGSYKIVQSKNEIDVAEIVISVTKATGTYHSVQFLDSDKSTVLLVTEVLENTTVDSAVAPTPKQLFKKFVGWKNKADDSAVDLSTLAVTSDMVLYASYEDDPIENENPNELTPAYLTKASAQVNSIEAGLVFTNTNYQVLQQSAFANEKNPVTLANGVTTSVYVQLNGKVQKGKCAIQANLPSAGVLTVYAYSGTSSANAFVLADTSATTISKADLSNTQITTVKLIVDKAGNYLIGGNGGTTRIYAAYFTPVQSDVAVQWDDDVAKTNLRVLGTLANVSDATKLGEVKVTVTLNKAEGKLVAEKVIETVYTSVSGLEGFGAKADTYYAVLVIQNVQNLVNELGAVSLDVKLEFVYDGVTYSDSLLVSSLAA